MSEFIIACQKEDIKEVDRLIFGGFPAYLYIKTIFVIIFENEYTNLYNYLVRYIKNHLLNKKGGLYNTNRRSILAYRLYLSIKSNEEDKFYDQWSTYCNSYGPSIDIRLIHKLMICDKITKETINNLKCCLINYVLDFEGYYHYYDDFSLRRLNEYKSLDKNQTIFKLTGINSNDDIGPHKCATIGNFWEVVWKFDEATKKYFFDAIVPKIKLDSGLYLLNNVLSDKQMDLYQYLVTNYRLQPQILTYSYSCIIGDYNFSMNLLYSIMGTKNINYITKRILKNRKNSGNYTMEMALNNSIKSRCQELIEFNKQLFRSSSYTNEKLDGLVKLFTNHGSVHDKLFTSNYEFRNLSTHEEINDLLSRTRKIYETVYNNNFRLDEYILTSTGYYECLLFHLDEQPDLLLNFGRPTDEQSKAIRKHINNKTYTELRGLLTFCNGIVRIVHDYIFYEY